MIKRIIILSCIILSANIQAEVPYVFTSGTPARASEVNHNFHTLDERVTVIEGASAGGSNCSNGISWWSRKHEVTIQPATSNIGQIITYNGVSYRIIEVPFKEFGTGDLYKVRFPVKEYATGQISGNISTEHTTNIDTCKQFYISGFPAFGNKATERRTLFFYNNGITESKSNLDMYYNVSIKINETNLAINFSVGKIENNILVGINDFDFTDDFDSNTMIHDQSLLSDVSSLLGYIQVSKVQ